MAPLNRTVFSSNCFVCCNKFEIEISNEKYKRQSQVCEQFCVHVSRYFNLNNNLNCSQSRSDIVIVEKTMEMFKSGTEIKNQTKKLNSCESCLPLLESICTVYKGWNHLQLRLNRSIKLIAKLMQEVSVNLANDADDDDHGDNNFKEALDFRKRFIIEALDKRSSQDFPHLKLKRLSNDSLHLCRKTENENYSNYLNYSLDDDELPSPPTSNVASISDIKLELELEPESNLKQVHVRVKVDEDSGTEDSDSGSADLVQPGDCDNDHNDNDDSKDKDGKKDRDVEPNNPKDSHVNKNILSDNEVSKKLKGTHKLFKCKICGDVITRRYTFLQHMNIHTNSKPLKCRFCSRGFHGDSARRYHEKNGDCNPNPEISFQYKCGICDKRFSQYRTCYIHQNAEHEGQKPRVIKLNRVENKNSNKNEICETCGKVFPSRRRLGEHMNSHTNSQPLKCRFCTRGFNAESNRRDHEKKCDSNPFPYKCGICNKKFSQYSTCFSHQNVWHEGQKRHVIKLDNVEEKNADWTTMTDLVPPNISTEEIDKHGQEAKPHKCTLCGNSFASKYNLQLHMSFHANARSFKCPFCGRVYSRRNNRNFHAKWCDSNPDKPATTVNRYKCYQCDLTFLSTNRLGEHVKKEHGGKIRFPCKVCGQLFLRHIDLKSHNESKHLNLKKPYPFMCDICGSVFQLLGSLYTHKRIKHSNPNDTRIKHSKPNDTTETFPCQFCGKQYRLKHQRQCHENRYCALSPANSTRFVCEKCGKELATKFALSKHMHHHKLEKGPGFPCSICGKTFKLSDQRNYHERYHREPAFACGYCGEKFIWDSSCRNHIKSKHKGQPLVGHVVNLLKESLPTSVPVVATVTTETPPVETPVLVTENSTESAN